MKTYFIRWMIAFTQMCVFASFATLAYSAGKIEAKKDGVEIVAAPQKGANVLSKLKKGESVSAGERKGMYWEVKTAQGQTGFVSVLSVKHQADQSANLGSAIRGVLKEGRGGSETDSARARSAVMGVRGLDDTSETAYAGSLKPNLRAVYAMEDYQIAKERLDKLGQAVLKEVEQQAEGTASP